MLKWIGTVCGILGALLVAANNGFQFVGYGFFTVGAIAWLAVSMQQKDKAGIVQWLFFSCVNVAGLINYSF